MEVTVMTGLPAKGDMEIDACHSDRLTSKIRHLPPVRRLLLLGLFFFPFYGWAQYTLHIVPVDKDSGFVRNQLGLTTAFRSQEACVVYVYNLLPLLQGRGYVAASIDSIGYAGTAATLRLYIGDIWRWARIDTRHTDPTL